MELINEKWVAAQFAVAIEYGDVTGISDEDDSKLDEWLQQFHKFDNPIIDLYSDTEFRVCDVTGLHADCILVKVCRDHAKWGFENPYK